MVQTMMSLSKRRHGQSSIGGANKTSGHNSPVEAERRSSRINRRRLGQSRMKATAAEVRPVKDGGGG
jgi:hypothetical protein